MIIIDCEASGLDSESYPIQIGWVNALTGEEDSFYISPAPGWDYWCFNAQEIHRIPRSFLSDVGLSPEKAAKRLIDRIPEGPLFCDAPFWDGFWIKRLFDAIGSNYPYDTHSVLSLISNDYHKDIIEDLGDMNRPHDALEDAKGLSEIVVRHLNKSPSSAAIEIMRRHNNNYGELDCGSQDTTNQ